MITNEVPAAKESPGSLYKELTKKRPLEEKPNSSSSDSDSDSDSYQTTDDETETESESESSPSPQRNDWFSRPRRVRSPNEDHELETRIVYASFDQMTGPLYGKGACSTIATLTARWLLTHPWRGAPEASDLDELITRGAAAWQALCEADPARLAKFPNGHFDLETVVDANVGPVTLRDERSHVGFFKNKDDDVSVDKAWERICDDVAELAAWEGRVYIVSWNDHFFVMKAGREDFYVVDSLGSRLSEDCETGYALKFDEQSRIESWFEDDLEWKIVVQGRDCCKEFLKRFLFGTVENSIREDVDDTMLLYQKLQIEFHSVHLS